MDKTILVAKKLLVVYILIPVVILSIVLPILLIEDLPEQNQFDNDPSYPTFAICIESNEDIENYNLTGDGTILNPFVIDNLTVNNSYTYGVFIRNTSKHFLVKGCFFNCTTGIEFDGSVGGTIEISNNDFWSFRGIRLRMVDESIITQNSFTNFSFGIYIDHSTSSTIRNNTFSNSLEYNWYDGISGTGIASDPYIIENLNVTTWDIYGIYIEGTTAHFIIQNCYLNSQQYGI